MNGILIFNLQLYEQKIITQKLFNPHWHELWKQEKSLVPPRGIFYKTQWAWQGVNFHLQKSVKNFDKQSADKVQSKKDKELGLTWSPLLLTITGPLTITLTGTVADAVSWSVSAVHLKKEINDDKY